MFRYGQFNLAIRMQKHTVCGALNQTLSFHFTSKVFNNA